MEPTQTISIAITVALTVVNVLVAYYLARQYGDLAGTKLTIKHEEKKSAEAHIMAIRSLLNEIARIRKLSDANYPLRGDIVTLVKMPTLAFETAFVSRDSLSVDGSVLEAALDYLVCADTINALIDHYYGLAPAMGTSRPVTEECGATRGQIRTASKGLPEILNRLSSLLSRELENVQQELNRLGRNL